MEAVAKGRNRDVDDRRVENRGDRAENDDGAQHEHLALELLCGVLL